MAEGVKRSEAAELTVEAKEKFTGIKEQKGWEAIEAFKEGLEKRVQDLEVAFKEICPDEA